MAARGGAGVDLDLDLVPLREASLTPYEIMLSESQERMVFVTQRGQEEAVVEILSRWGLEASKIGRVTDSGRARLTFRGRTVADMPVEPLVDGAPVYDRPAAPPADLRERQRAGRLRSAGGSASGAQESSRDAGTRRQNVDPPAVRLDRAVEHDRRSGLGRRRAAAQGNPFGPGADVGRQPVPTAGSSRGWAGGRPWPRRFATWRRSARNRWA